MAKVTEARIEKIENGYIVYLGSPVCKHTYYQAIGNALDAIRTAMGVKNKE